MSQGPAKTKTLQRDFTQGSIPKHLLMFSIPMFLGNLLQMLYNTVDSIWVGRFLGAQALGAVSISMPLIFALLSLVMGLTMATTTLVSQYRGAGDEGMVRKTVANSLILLGGSSLIISVLGVVFRYPLLRLIQAPPEILDDSAAYLGIFMGGVMGMFIYNTMGAILRGLGDSRTPLTYLAVATVANIILDPIFLFGFGPLPALGVAGVAWATVISQGMSAVLMVRWMYKHTDLMPRTKVDWGIDGTLVRQILKIGLPSGLQQMLVSLGMVTVTSIINGFGAEVVAAYGAANRLDQFAWMPAMSIGLAVTSMVGQNLGAGRFDRVKAVVRWSSLMGAATTGVVGIVAFVNPTILMVMFTTDPAVLAEGAAYLRTMSFSYVPFALLFILGGVMRGSGDTLAGMIFTLAALWGIRVPLAAIMARSMGVQGVWLAICLSAVIGLAMQWGYYMTGRWKRRLVGKGAPSPAADAAD